MSQAAFAAHVGMDAGQMSRTLAEPQNWGLDTVAKLLVGSGFDPRKMLAEPNGEHAISRDVEGRAPIPPVSAEIEKLLALQREYTRSMAEARARAEEAMNAIMPPEQRAEIDRLLAAQREAIARALVEVPAWSVKFSAATSDEVQQGIQQAPPAELGPRLQLLRKGPRPMRPAFELQLGNAEGA